MPDYVILTDSSADLSAEMVREAGVTVLPLSFTIQGETYENTPDNREMDRRCFTICSGRGSWPPPPPSM